MRKLILVLLLSLFSSRLFGQSAGDIVGYWYGPKEEGGEHLVVELFERNGKYYAYGFAYKGNASTPLMDDKHNSDPALRGRSLRGVVFMYDLTFDAQKKAWVGGEIYRPTDGKYFYLKSKSLSADKNKLTWRASIDKSGMMGADLHWTRIPTAELSAYMDKKPPMDKILATIPSIRHKK